MEKRGIFIILIVLMFFSFSFVSSQNFGYNILKPSPCVGNEVRVANGNCVAVTDPLANNTANVNSSQFWITNIGSLGNVNSTQFSNNGGFLNIIESWVRSLFSNPFDQVLNITSNVIFANITSTGNFTVTKNLTVFGNSNFKDNSFIINDKGLVVGHTSFIDFGAVPTFQIIGNGGSDASMAFARFQAVTGGATLRFLKSRSNTIGVNTLVLDGDELGRIRFQGADGNDFNTNAAEISAEVDGSPGVNDLPGRIIFSTTSDGSSSVTERMRIQSNGLLNLSGDFIVDGGDIGLSIDPDLMQLINGELDINGDLLVTGTIFGGSIQADPWVGSGNVNISNSVESILVFEMTGGTNPTDITFDLDGSIPRIFSATDLQIEITDILSVTSDFIVDSPTFFVASSSNRVGIGTLSPTSLLNVVGGSIKIGDSTDITASRRLIFDAGSSSQQQQIQFRTAGSNTFTIFKRVFEDKLRLFSHTQSADIVVLNGATGRIGIKTENPTHTLNVVGDLNVTVLGSATANDLCISQSSGGVLSTCSSARRYKENIINLTVTQSLWNKYMNLNPVRYQFIGDSQIHVGLIAEEVQEVFPKFVFNKTTFIYSFQNITIVDEDTNESIIIQNRTLVDEISEVESYYRSDLITTNTLFIQDLQKRLSQIEAETCARDNTWSWC